MDPPHTSLVPQTIPTIFSSGIPNSPQMIAGLRPWRCSWRVCAAIACHNNTHNCDVCFFRFPNENYGDRYVLIVSSMKLMYHKDWRTDVLSQILSVTHPPAVGLRSRCRPLTSVSFNYAPSLPPFMQPVTISRNKALNILAISIWSYIFNVLMTFFGNILVDHRATTTGGISGPSDMLVDSGHRATLILSPDLIRASEVCITEYVFLRWL